MASLTAEDLLTEMDDQAAAARAPKCKVCKEFSEAARSAIVLGLERGHTVAQIARALETKLGYPSCVDAITGHIRRHGLKAQAEVARGAKQRA